MPPVDCVNAEIQSIASSASSNPTGNQVASSSFDMTEHLQGLLNAAEERERNNANPDTVQQPQNESQAEEQHDNASMKTHLLQLLDAALARGDAALANDDDVDPKKNEIVREHDVTVLVDPKAVFFMVGTTMDYNETELAAEFTFVNPNVKGECGCGESFNL